MLPGVMLIIVNTQLERLLSCGLDANDHISGYSLNLPGTRKDNKYVAERLISFSSRFKEVLSHLI